MNDNQLETLKQLGDLGCYVAMDTRLCKVAYDEIISLRQQLAATPFGVRTLVVSVTASDWRAALNNRAILRRWARGEA